MCFPSCKKFSFLSFVKNKMISCYPFLLLLIIIIILTWMLLGVERSNMFYFTFVSLAILFLT